MSTLERPLTPGERRRRIVEQLGAPSGGWAVAHAQDVLEKVLPGALARLRVTRENESDGEWNVRPFVEQLGVASGKNGLRHPADALRALFGLSARWSVGRYAGVDYRARAYTLIEQRLLQIPMPSKRKALMLSIAYAIASKLPDTR
jgi:hypothetical protein